MRRPVRLAMLRERGCPVGRAARPKRVSSARPLCHIELSLEPSLGPGAFFGVCVMRRVLIVEKPNETFSYAAVDQQTGEVLLRLSDRHALVALCQRLEWAVEEKSESAKQAETANP